MARGREAQVTGGHPDHWVQVEPSPRRVRALFGGETVADSKRVILMREARHTPVYYFPREDVRVDLMRRSAHRTH